MKLRFHLDPETGLPHVYEHNVTEEEVRHVLLGLGEDRRGTDRSRVKIGQTAAGRYLKVVYVPDKDADSVFVVTAHDLRNKPLRAYRRRRRRKQK